ncbi:MAG TPA: YcxB family protein [Terriglobales bacterium]|nr:YcxB family protein [Terriglobales bacterium]
MPVLGAILVVGWIGFAFTRGVSSHSLAIPIFPSLFLLSPLFHKWNAKSTYAKATSFHGPLQLDADEGGLFFRGVAFSGKIGWSNFSNFFEDENGFVLYQNTGVFNILPKRQLSAEQISWLRDNFQRKINGSN